MTQQCFEVAENARATTLEVLVRTMEWAAEDVLAVTLASLGGETLPGWEAGAHVDVLTPSGAKAQYSLCGPAGAPTWRIAVLLKQDGRGVSRYVHQQLRPGQRVRVAGPRNHFRLVPAKRYLFIAGGIGVTPILPMIGAAQRAGAEWQMAYGGRSRRAMAFLTELQHHGSRVRLFPEDERGRLPLASLLGHAGPGTSVYCCGPEPLLAAVETLAAEFALDRPIVERFSPVAAPPAEAADKPFTVKLARAGGEYVVPANRSVAQVLLDHGVEVPISCLQGICGTCETRVLSGAIDHRDALLSQDERHRQDTMMICVSRCHGGELVLDL